MLNSSHYYIKKINHPVINKKKNQSSYMIFYGTLLAFSTWHGEKNIFEKDYEKSKSRQFLYIH